MTMYKIDNELSLPHPTIEVVQEALITWLGVEMTLEQVIELIKDDKPLASWLRAYNGNLDLDQIHTYLTPALLRKVLGPEYEWPSLEEATTVAQQFFVKYAMAVEQAGYRLRSRD
jgi:hypothetical protein